MYRRLTEPSARKRERGATLGRAWAECMDKWMELLGAREKALGNVHVNKGNYVTAALAYTRAISLDGKKTVYYTNRVVALNAMGEHEAAEADCTRILTKDPKNSKAYYQRALARKGLRKWREAEQDLNMVIKLQPNESARNLLDTVKAEVKKLPKLRHEDVLNF